MTKHSPSSGRKPNAFLADSSSSDALQPDTTNSGKYKKYKTPFHASPPVGAPLASASCRRQAARRLPLAPAEGPDLWPRRSRVGLAVEAAPRPDRREGPQALGGVEAVIASHGLGRRGGVEPGHVVAGLAAAEGEDLRCRPKPPRAQGSVSSREVVLPCLPRAVVLRIHTGMMVVGEVGGVSRIEQECRAQGSQEPRHH